MTVPPLNPNLLLSPTVLRPYGKAYKPASIAIRLVSPARRVWVEGSKKGIEASSSKGKENYIPPTNGDTPEALEKKPKGPG